VRSISYDAIKNASQREKDLTISIILEYKIIRKLVDKQRK
jgi:hypothetical protein